MDSLDTFDSLDTQETGAVSAEWSPEVKTEKIEKQKEVSAKALAGIGRSRKDESKSKRQSNLLARVIQSFIQLERQDEVLSQIVMLLEKEVPSYVVLSLSIIASEEALKIVLEELHTANTFPKLTGRSEKVQFKESVLTSDEKRYINTWLETVFIILSEDVSVMMTQKFAKLLNSPVREDIVQALTEFLKAFFSTVGLNPTAEVSAYSKFIVGEMERRLYQIVLEDIDTGEKVRL